MVVQAIRSNVQLHSSFGLIIGNCRSLISELQDFQSVIVYRSANRVAHNLARDSYSFPERVIRRDDIPAAISSIMLVDC